LSGEASRPGCSPYPPAPILSYLDLSPPCPCHVSQPYIPALEGIAGRMGQL
jgi:hypothetical protein